jgi:hypothetical protein
MATTRDSRAQSKGETTHPLAGHSLSDKAFIDHMFFRLSPMLPQGAQLHNESTTTGKEKSDGRSR